MDWNNICLCLLVGKTTLLMAFNIIRGGFITDLPHILSIHMLIISCPWALFECKFCITFLISFSVNTIFDKDLSVLECRTDEIALLLSIIEHCLAKKELHNSAFSLELVTKHFREKLVEFRVFFYCYGKILMLTNMFSDLFIDPLLFMLNENNICLDTSMKTP